MEDNASNWLLRAKSNLEHARIFNENSLFSKGGSIFYEDLCFDLQQCVEKTFKVLLILNNFEFPKTHDIDKLIKLLKINGINVPDKILDAGMLTQYAVRTRYFDYDVRNITQEEYEEALEITENVYNWAENLVKTQ